VIRRRATALTFSHREITKIKEPAAILLLQNFLIKCPHGQGDISGGAPPV
jgi:hypothetical protein